MHLATNCMVLLDAFCCRLKEVGQTVAGKRGEDDSITLAQQNFQIGDFMDIAIQLPREPRRMPY